MTVISSTEPIGRVTSSLGVGRQRGRIRLVLFAVIVDIDLVTALETVGIATLVKARDAAVERDITLRIVNSYVLIEEPLRRAGVLHSSLEADGSSAW